MLVSLGSVSRLRYAEFGSFNDRVRRNACSHHRPHPDRDQPNPDHNQSTNHSIDTSNNKVIKPQKAATQFPMTTNRHPSTQPPNHPHNQGGRQAGKQGCQRTNVQAVPKQSIAMREERTVIDNETDGEMPQNTLPHRPWC